MFLPRSLVNIQYYNDSSGPRGGVLDQRPPGFEGGLKSHCSECKSGSAEIALNLLAFKGLYYKKDFFAHLKLCLATATHNFKWMKINYIREI